MVSTEGQFWNNPGKILRILQISLYYAPDKTGIAVTSAECAEWFAHQGHIVDVVTGPPFYPEWRIKRYELRKMTRKNPGINVYRTFLYVPRKITTITRLIHEISFSFFSFFRALRLKRPNVIIVVSPPLTSALSGILLKAIWRRKLLLNVKDLVPDAAIELNMLTNRSAISMMLFIEKNIYKISDQIASLGEGVLGRIRVKGIDSAKLLLLPDTADPFLLGAERRPVDQNIFLKNNEINDPFIVLHSGNMGVKQGIDVIIEAARILENREIAFYIVGDGAVKQSIVKMAAQNALHNVHFLPLQPREILADMYHAADIGLLTQKREVVDIVVPSKLISMMAAGTCLIASAHPNSEASRMVKDSGSGRVVNPEDPKELADAIDYFYRNRRMIEHFRRNAKKYAMGHFRREGIMKKYESALQQLAQS